MAVEDEAKGTCQVLVEQSSRFETQLGLQKRAYEGPKSDLPT